MSRDNAVAESHRAIYQWTDALLLVSDDQGTSAATGDFLDQVPDEQPSLGIETHVSLIEQEEVGCQNQQAGKLDAAPHTIR